MVQFSQSTYKWCDFIVAYIHLAKNIFMRLFITMDIIILINSKLFDYHKHISDDFIQSIHNVIPDSTIKIIDMNSNLFLHEIFGLIKEFKPQLLINFDYVGFSLHTESGTLSLNQLPMQCANIQFKSKSHYINELSFRQNFSMYTYIPKDENLNEYILEFPHITNFSYFCNITINNLNEYLNSKNKHSISKWLPKMLKDLWL